MTEILKKIYNLEDTYIKFQLYKQLTLFGIKFKKKILDYEKYISKVPPLVNKELEKINPDEINIHSDYVWTMWLQDNPPELIQMCLASIKKYYPNVIILTERTISDYIVIPDYIYQKYKNGNITAPHFSDYIRCCLLDKYGGLWIDASCLLLDKCPNFITKQEFFLLRDPDKINISNFFIYSTKNNYIIKCMKKLLELYWKDKNIACAYFFWHRCFKLFIEKDEKFKKIFKKAPVVYNSQIKYLTDNPFQVFNIDVWEWMKKASWMYKLNRKRKKAIAKPNGFYAYMLNEYAKLKSNK